MAPTPCADLARLRRAFAELAEGVHTIHEHGILHSDIKPSNILVTARDRVVLLDFGLVREILADRTQSANIAGTPAYMAPEQVEYGISKASDWYSVGVVLYECLVGRRPFTGSPLAMLRDKQEIVPPSPRSLLGDIPEDLDGLCMGLLERSPDVRLAGAAVLERLGPVVAVSTVSAHPSLSRSESAIVGRDKEMARLHAAFQCVDDGQPTTLMVRGRSGMGKTVLVRNFLNELDSQHPDESVILTGRCYERESVPYKAVDSLIDALARYLKQQSPVRAARWLPRGIVDLVRLFPVLDTVDVIAQTPRRDAGPIDIQRTRRRAFVALRELLGALANDATLVLFIDDLQWGDVDSGMLLRELIRPPDPPQMLLVLGHRLENIAASDLLGTLSPPLDQGTGAPEMDTITLDELPPADACTLARASLGPDPALAPLAESIARESGGNPFFVEELARYASTTKRAAKLDEVLGARVSELLAGARRLLEIISVSGQPLPREVAVVAGQIHGDNQPALDLLRVRHLIEIHGAPSPAVETYHDRIRETVVRHLDDATLREHHQRLARAWGDRPDADPQVLTTHCLGAGDTAQAATHAAAAAERASGGLAFERAAQLYRLVLDIAKLSEDDERVVRIKLAEALANDGRGQEAGREFLRAAAGAEPNDALRLETSATQQFWQCGLLDEGLEVATRALDAVGLPLTESPARAMLGILLRRTIVRWRGLRFVEREEAAVSADDRQRLDTSLALSGPLTMIDVVRGQDVVLRQTLLALRVGEPRRLVRAVALQMASGVYGAHHQARAQSVIADALSLAQRQGDPAGVGIVLTGTAFSARASGQFQKSLDLLEDALVAFKDLPGALWELQTARIFVLENLLWLGRWSELFRRLPAFLEGAVQRGDRYRSAYMHARIGAMERLADNDPEGALAEAQRGVADWSDRGYHLQHYQALESTTQAHEYAGNPAAAWETLEHQWPQLEKSHLLSIPAVRITCLRMRARAALAMAVASASTAQSKTYADMAHKLQRGLRREGLPWADAHAESITASLAAVRADEVGLVDALRRARKQFETLGMAMYAATTQYRLGEVLGGDEGDALVTAAATQMTAEQVRDPARMAAMFLPLSVH